MLDAPDGRSDGAPSLVVGLAAYAGGREALEQLFDAIPDASRIGFVIVEFPDGTEPTRLAEVLARRTPLEVVEVVGEAKILPGRIYVAVAGRAPRISGGVLRCSRSEHRPAPIAVLDRFFRSLAADQNRRAVALILSGRGTDGALGTEAICEHGGVALAQDPQSAAAEQMLRRVVSSGAVDAVLSVEEIASLLVRHAKHPYVCESPVAGTAEPAPGAGGSKRRPGQRRVAAPTSRREILALLRERTGRDLSAYRDAVPDRQALRRMSLCGCRCHAEYLELLCRRPDEIDALARAIAGPVTRFFREPDAWLQLERRVLARLVAGKRAGDPIRLWAVGCATGEEAYSLAMLVTEQLERTGKSCPLRVFATELDRRALERARRGRYPTAIRADVSRERLERFFEPEKDGVFVVERSLRDAVVFSEHDLLADPPFQQLELICCRNLLGDLQRAHHERILALFRSALANSGYIFLGAAESLASSEGFEAVDEPSRIFRATDASDPASRQLDLPLVAGTAPPAAGAVRGESSGRPLWARHEQLQQRNEQLQARNEQLQVRNAQLRTRNAELSARNDELREAKARLVHWSTELERGRAQLERSNERLQLVDRRKDEFLALLGHEMRNPLAAIRSATELMDLVGTDDARLAQIRSVLERQSVRMARLADGLLDVSRIARGKMELELERFDARRALEGVLQDRTAQARARGLELRHALPDQPLWIRGDSVRLAQIFDNLLGNAIKFTEAPGCISLIALRRDDLAVVRVRDTGIGIRPELLSRIFEPFEQEPQEMARAAGGLGLGLALVAALVELHGGAIEARSAGEGSGAEFEVRLPLATPPSAPNLPTHRQRAAPRRVLVVEDNQDTAQLVSDLLRARGHRVLVVHHGSAALEALRQQVVEVAICDIGLPGMSGYELARAIRGDPILRGLALIALTGYGLPTHRRRTEQAGFDVHLTKPVTLDALEDALRQLEHRRCP